MFSPPAHVWCVHTSTAHAFSFSMLSPPACGVTPRLRRACTPDGRGQRQIPNRARAFSRSATHRKQTPARVRPARPLRRCADACETHVGARTARPRCASYAIALARPASITTATSSIVIEVFRRARGRRRQRPFICSFVRSKGRPRCQRGSQKERGRKRRDEGDRDGRERQRVAGTRTRETESRRNTNR